MYELRDIYTEKRQLTGMVKEREKPLLPGEYILVAYVCLINSKGQMLIQKRQKDKRSCPDLWDLSVGGCALAGETSSQTAERETLEEIGYSHSFGGSKPDLALINKCAFFDVFVIHGDPQLSQLSVQKSEIQEVKWASQEEIIEMIKDGQFVPYSREMIESCFRIGARQQN